MPNPEDWRCIDELDDDQQQQAGSRIRNTSAMEAQPGSSTAAVAAPGLGVSGSLPSPVTVTEPLVASSSSSAGVLAVPGLAAAFAALQGPTASEAGSGADSLRLDQGQGGQEGMGGEQGRGACERLWA